MLQANQALATPGADVHIDADPVLQAIRTLPPGQRAVVVAAAPDAFWSVVLVDLATGEDEVLRRSTPHAVDRADISVPETIEFPTTGGRTAFALYLRPVNRAFEAPAGEKPPLIVTSHGGPTAAAFNGLGVPQQLFASRGFAIVDVDYGGSNGYGRDYRKRLEGEWGVVDVDDCVAAARYLVDRGEVDPERLIIRGGSASGFTSGCEITVQPSSFSPSMPTFSNLSATRTFI